MNPAGDWAQRVDGEDPALAIDVARTDGAVEIVLRGALDLSTADRFDSALEAALRTGAARVKVDLDALEFVDSTGLAAILGAIRRADGDGRVTVTRGTGEVAQLFRLTALDLVLPFE
jgi:anti-sigma B factor antagonist